MGRKIVFYIMEYGKFSLTKETQWNSKKTLLQDSFSTLGNMGTAEKHN